MASPHAQVFAQQAADWARDLPARMAAVEAAGTADLPARLHELRSLSHVVGARGLAAAAAECEQRVERGLPLAPDDIDLLRRATEVHRRAILAAWETR